MEKQRLRAGILGHLRNRELVLFGAGEVARGFYNRYKEELNFAFSVTNNSREWGEKRFCQELDIKPYSEQELKGRYYIVLCIYFGFDEVAVQLECDDYIMFDDFVDYKIAEAILEYKKIAFFYGNCVVRDIHQMVKWVPAFREQYSSTFIQSRKNETMFDIRRLYYGKKVCDAYIYGQKLINLSDPYNMQREDLPNDCKMIGVSTLTFHGYWPQQLQNVKYSDDWIFEVTAPFDNYFWHLMYAREDLNLKRLVEEGRTPEEICDIVSAEDFYSEKEVKKHLRMCFKSLEMVERGMDVRVSDFIKKNYQKERLYQDYIHLKKPVLWEYVKQVLQYLEVEEAELDEIIETSPEYVHQAGDIPIYPSVAKHLGLDWVKKDTVYEILTCKGVRFMTFREYVIHYSRYLQASLELQKGW